MLHVANWDITMLLGLLTGIRVRGRFGWIISNVLAGNRISAAVIIAVGVSTTALTLMMLESSALLQVLLQLLSFLDKITVDFNTHFKA